PSGACAAAGGGEGGGSTTAGAHSGGGGTMTTKGTGVADGGPVSDSPSPGCPTFPPFGTKECDPGTLGPTKIAYPTDGLLLPPNMNVLEVQFIPPAGATLFEVDFKNSVTQVTVATMCNPVPPVRGGPSLGCGITLSQAAWNDIANINRDGDPLHVTVRATKDMKCVSTSQDKIDINFAKEDIAGGIYYWQAAVYGGIGGK